MPRPTSRRATRSSLPFADGEFDRVVAAEVLEHIPADVEAIKELVRVLRPGGTLAISVPRWLPEVVNWKLSEDYHNAAGGHIRIYTGQELVTRSPRLARGPPAAMVFAGKRPRPRPAHALLVDQVRRRRHQRRPPAREGVPRLLVWEIMKNPGRCSAPARCSTR